jgi:hypothetical protein
MGHEVKNAPRKNRIVCQPLWAVDGLVHVGDQTSRPAPILVAEDPQGSSPAAAYGALRDDAAQFAVPVRDRRHLDREPPLRHSDDERGVIERTPRSLLEPRRYGLEQASVQAHRMTAGPQREPIEVNAGL